MSVIGPGLPQNYNKRGFTVVSVTHECAEEGTEVISGNERAPDLTNGDAGVSNRQFTGTKSYSYRL